MPKIYEGICAHCGQAYRGTGAKYCCYACRAAAVYHRVVYTCQHCGKPVNINGTQSLAREAKYCSQTCKLAATQVRYTCIQCGKELAVPASRATYTAMRFCSPACRGAYRTAQAMIIKPCEECGKPFQARRCVKKQAHFCSPECFKRALAKRMTGPRVPDRFLERTCKWCGQPFKVARTKEKWKANAGTFCSAACRNRWTLKYSYHKISKEEQVFADLLMARGLVFEQQAEAESYCVDILFRSERVVVEFDGDYWHSLPRMIASDARKDATLSAKGYRVVRVPESLYRSDREAAVNLVLAAL